MTSEHVKGFDGSIFTTQKPWSCGWTSKELTVWWSNKCLGVVVFDQTGKVCQNKHCVFPVRDTSSWDIICMFLFFTHSLKILCSLRLSAWQSEIVGAATKRVKMDTSVKGRRPHSLRTKMELQMREVIFKHWKKTPKNSSKLHWWEAHLTALQDCKV